jgi:hypothetical protein
MDARYRHHYDKMPGGYFVRDANGQALAYLYGRENEDEARQAKVLTKDEARRGTVRPMSGDPLIDCRTGLTRRRRRLPFAGELLRFLYLRGGHLRGDFVPSLRRVWVPARRSQAEPHVRDDIVLRALAVAGQWSPGGVLDPEGELSMGVAVLGKWTRQSQRRRVVAPNVGGKGILQWPCGNRASKANGKHESGDGCLEGAVHPDNPL